MDPLFKKYSGESPYSFAGNNPIFFVDKNGLTKDTYYTIIDKTGQSITFKVTDKNYVEKITTHHSIDVGLGAQGEYINFNTTTEYDVNQYVIYDYSKSTNGAPTVSADVDFIERPSTLKKIFGTTEGIAMSSKDGEGGAPEGLGDGKILNIDDLVSLLGGMGEPHSTSNGNTKTDKAKDLIKTIGNLITTHGSFKSVSEKIGVDLTKPASEQKVKCEACGETIKASEKSSHAGDFTPAKARPLRSDEK